MRCATACTTVPAVQWGIAIYDDRVEIENSGTFPPDITMEKLLSGHNSEPQNLIIANVLYKKRGLGKLGTGHRAYDKRVPTCRHPRSRIPHGRKQRMDRFPLYPESSRV